MNKYIAPTIKIEEIDASDIILASSSIGYEVKSLKGVDTDGEESAVFDVMRWF